MKHKLAWALLAVASAGCTLNDERDSATESVRCTADTCGAGSFCSDEGVCKSIAGECVQPNTCTCQIINMAGQLPVDDSLAGQVVPAGVTWQPEVVLNTPQRTFPQSDFTLSLEGASPASFSVEGSAVTSAKAAGSAQLVAHVGAQVVCRAPLTNLGVAAPGSHRFYVFDRHSGLAVAGAQVVLQAGADAAVVDTVSTDAGGLASTAADLADAYAVTVFAAGYHYLTVAGLQASAGADLALPVSAQEPAQGGFSGRMDYADYEDATSGLPRPVRFALASGSLPLDGLLQFNLSGAVLQSFLTDTMESCDPSAPGCYVMSMRDGKHNVPLPGSLQLQAGLQVKTSFDVRANSGHVLPFALGGEMKTPDAEALPPLGLAAFGEEEGKTAQLLQTITDVLPTVGVGTRAPLALPAIDPQFWTNQTNIKDLTGRPPYPGLPVLDKGKRGPLRLQSPMAHWLDVALVDFPEADLLDTAIVATGVNARGFGFVPLGVGLGFDTVSAGALTATAMDKDRRVVGMKACQLPNTCVDSGPTQLADGHLPLFYARPMGGLEVHPQLTLMLGISISETVGLMDEQLLVGRVIPGAPSAAGLANLPWMTAPWPGDLTERSYGWESPSPAQLHWLRFKMGAATEWHVFVAGTSTEWTAPAVPAGWADLGGTPQVAHLALQTDGTSLDQLAHRHVAGLSHFAESVRAFALRSKTFY